MALSASGLSHLTFDQIIAGSNPVGASLIYFELSKSRGIP